MTVSAKWGWVKAIVSLSLMALLLYSVDLPKMKGTFLSADLSFLAVSVCLSFAAWLIATIKWQRLLAALGEHPSYGDLLSLNFISIFYSFFLPGQIGGEIAKGIRFASAGGKARHAIASITAERLTGLLVMLFMAAGSIFYENPYVNLLGWCILGISLVACVCVFLMGSKRLQGQPIVLRLVPARGTISRLVTCFEPYYQKPLSILEALLFSLVFQFLVVLIDYLVCLSLSIRIPFFTLVWIVAIVGILRALPISISGIGVREGGYVLLLGSYGVSSSQALSFSLIVFGISFIMGLTGGFLDVFKRIRVGERKEPL
jgi:glycosyltransferase 2 family protein